MLKSIKSPKKRTGYNRDQLIGKHICELFPERGSFDQFKRVVETQQSDAQEHYSPDDPGSGWFYQQVIPIGDGVAVTSRDISYRKESETALQESERRFRELAENSPDVIIIVDIETTKPLYVNKDEFLAVDMEAFKQNAILTGLCSSRR